MVTIPDTMSYEEATALQFGGITSLIHFDLGHLTPGETLLINGASGAVGVMAVQIARHMGRMSPPFAAPAMPTWSGVSAPKRSSTTKQPISALCPNGSM